MRRLLVIVLCLSCRLAAAGSWQGYLADSNCFATEERNKSPTDMAVNADRDRGFEIRYCHPTPKTKSFAFIQRNGLIFQLDAAGDAKAAELVHAAGKNAANFSDGKRRKERLQDPGEVDIAGAIDLVLEEGVEPSCSVKSAGF